MPRYFFHVRDGVDQPDLTGTELQDDDVARKQAKIVSARIIHDLGDKFWTGREWQMLVYAETEHLLTLHFTGTVIDRRR